MGEKTTAGRQAKPGGNSAATVERAADVLLLFARSTSSQLGVTEIANELGVSKSAVHRILLSFRNKALVELDPVTRRYSLSPTILGLGWRFASRLDVRFAASGELSALSRATNETATLSIRSGDQRVYVDQVIPNREVLMSVELGTAHPLHAGASSKALLAFLPASEVDRYLNTKLDKVTAGTVTDVRELRRELADIRARGWAKSFSERLIGAGSVAAPVFDGNSEPVAVVSVCGPADRVAGEIEMCVEHLLVATKRISARLGHP